MSRIEKKIKKLKRREKRVKEKIEERRKRQRGKKEREKREEQNNADVSCEFCRPGAEEPTHRGFLRAHRCL